MLLPTIASDNTPARLFCCLRNKKRAASVADGPQTVAKPHRTIPFQATCAPGTRFSHQYAY
jgi:hypothetical protein